jgi:hypothetical protein
VRDLVNSGQDRYGPMAIDHDDRYVRRRKIRGAKAGLPSARICAPSTGQLRLSAT